MLFHLGLGGAQKVALLHVSFFGAEGWRMQLITMLSGSGQAHAIHEGLLVTDFAPAVDALWKRDQRNLSLILRGHSHLALKRLCHHHLAHIVMGFWCGS